MTSTLSQHQQATRRFSIKDEDPFEEINRMLEQTRPTEIWQDHLLNMLRSCFTQVDMRRTLAFLEHVISQGKDALFNGKYELTFDHQRAPELLDLGSWKSLLIALGFETEEPDGRHSIEHIYIGLGQGVMLHALNGMLLLLSLFQDLDLELQRLVLHLLQDQARLFFSLVQDSDKEIDQRVVRELANVFPDEIKLLGFHKNGRTYMKKASHNLSKIHRKLAVVLFALFPIGPQLIETFI
ncbi:unnamed protein product [Lymnaea stagnalis]|uniref:Uncharacterized protein n=1 Tax=Lymnaea stagnalis TaxID=6523 RepID=A0AAV2HCA0_LYMST